MLLHNRRGRGGWLAGAFSRQRRPGMATEGRLSAYGDDTHLLDHATIVGKSRPPDHVSRALAFRHEGRSGPFNMETH